MSLVNIYTRKIMFEVLEFRFDNRTQDELRLVIHNHLQDFQDRLSDKNIKYL